MGYSRPCEDFKVLGRNDIIDIKSQCDRFASEVLAAEGRAERKRASEREREFRMFRNVHARFRSSPAKMVAVSHLS